MTPGRRSQTRFIFPLGSFDLPPRPPAPGPSRVDLGCYCSDFNSAGIPCPAGTCPNRPTDPAPAPELRTVYDDDQRPPGIDAEDEPDPTE